MAVAFNTGKHARAIREGGVPAPAADAIVDAITDATARSSRRSSCAPRWPARPRSWKPGST